MFIILLISSALGACKDIKVEKDCWADRNCEWAEDEEENMKCYESWCVELPMKGLCEGSNYCEWKDGKCSPIDCRRYEPTNCPTEGKKCKIYTNGEEQDYCFPYNSDPKPDDSCTESLNVYGCAFRSACVWEGKKCKYNGCSREEATAAKCKDSDGCKIIKATEEEEDDECHPKSYDPKNPLCGRLTEGAECDTMLECMTVSGKCKEDECLEEGKKADCEKKSGCTWGKPEILKDWREIEEGICYHKDHEFEAGALSVFPALVQNKIFQLASAFLLFLLI